MTLIALVPCRINSCLLGGEAGSVTIYFFGGREIMDAGSVGRHETGKERAINTDLVGVWGTVQIQEKP